MREIKFRAWDKKRKRMYEVLHLHLEESFGSTGIWATAKGRDIIEDKDIHLQIQPKDIEIMQSTGLKDKNGKWIYEGDILDGSWINPMSQEIVKRHYKVVFEKGNFYAQLIGHHPYGTTMLYFENEKGEVIGNIYETPSEVTP